MLLARADGWCFWLGPISGSHQGQRPERLHSEAEYMAAPERFAESQIPLASRAPSLQQPSSVHRTIRVWRRDATVITASIVADTS